MLDTLMNVVGILVIVLVAVQISSQEAASRIVESLSKIDPEELARLEAAAATAKEQIAVATKEIQTQRQAVMDPRAEISRLQAELQIEEDMAREAATVSQQRAAAMAAATREAETRLADQRKRKLEAVEAVQAKLEVVQQKLESTPVIDVRPTKAVRLPDPRPAPPGVGSITVLCRDGQVWVVDADALREKALRRADYVVRTKKLDPDGDRWLDGGTTIVDEFNKAPVKDRAFEVTLDLVNGKWPQMVLTRISGRGESIDDAVKPTGDFARALRRLSPETHILQFLVWPDSFEAYLTARELANSQNFSAGWEPMTTPAEYRIGLGKYVVGVKPAPKPAGPPPPPPDPNQKPPPPPDVLD